LSISCKRTIILIHSKRTRRKQSYRSVLKIKSCGCTSDKIRLRLAWIKLKLSWQFYRG